MAVVVLDREALYAGSLFGQRVRADVDAALRALAAENRRIEADLEAEEQALTDARAETDTDAFQTLARDFDARVEEIRRTQDAKERGITSANERAQARFFELATPVLSELARESGALVILDRRIVIAAADQVDITPEAIERVDAALGEGEGIATDPPAEDAAPAPGGAPAAD
nr:OmpH family outer membrane protein [Jannaschia sp. Os4]